MTIHNIIYSLYPNIKKITEPDLVAYDVNENVVEYDKSLVEFEWNKISYKEKRQPEYPSLVDFADAYYWVQKGNDTLMNDYIAKCDAIKDNYPKPE
jgi:hypothetical protein